MPRVVQTASLPLKELCLRSITNKIDSYWCRDFLEKYSGTIHFMYVLGPFDDLPPNLIHDIWLCLKRRKLLRKHHGYLLISPYLTKLDLSHCEDLTLSLLLASQRCFQLTNLDLSHNRLPKDMFSKTIPNFTKITSLSMSYSNVSDVQVSIIGIYMPQLTSLDLSYCTGVSDRGLKSLVLGQDSGGGSDARFGQCQRLSRLLVSGCQNVTCDSVEMLILHLDRLSVLDYCDTVGVIHQIVDQQKAQKKLLLKSLYCGESCSSESLSLALSVCPHVEHVYVVLSQDVTCQSLLSLLDITCLHELHVRDETTRIDDDSLIFSDVMNPVLTKHGDTLVSINFAEVFHVDVAAICDTCPNLLHVALLWNKSYTISDISGQRQWFPKLKTVEYSVFQPNEMPPNNLLLILRSPHLKSLKIRQSCHLSDQIIEDTLSIHSFQYLENLELNKCHSLSFEGLEMLLEHENNIESVKLLECEQITKRDIQIYQKKLKKWKWNLNLEWS